jgi:hypothetical protein
MDLVEVLGAVGWTCENHGERQFTILRIEQNAQQVQDLLGRARTARKNDDAMAQPHESFQTLFDVRHDHQLADDGVGRFGRDDAGLGDAQVPPADDALLRVPDGRALHGALHGAGTAPRAHVQAAKPDFIADFLRIVVFDPPDGVAAPANDEIRPHLQFQNPGIAQDMKYRIGDARG